MDSIQHAEEPERLRGRLRRGQQRLHLGSAFDRALPDRRFDQRQRFGAVVLDLPWLQRRRFSKLLGAEEVGSAPPASARADGRDLPPPAAREGAAFPSQEHSSEMGTPRIVISGRFNRHPDGRCELHS